MTQDELNLWVSYVDENGPVNPSLRVDAAVARALSKFIRNSKPSDFMPWPRKPEPELTPEAAHLMFKNLAAKTAAKRKS